VFDLQQDEQDLYDGIGGTLDVDVRERFRWFAIGYHLDFQGVDLDSCTLHPYPSPSHCTSHSPRLTRGSIITDNTYTGQHIPHYATIASFYALPPDEIDALEDLGRRTPDPRLDARNFVLSSYLVKKAGKWERKCGREVRDAFVYYAFGVKVREPGLRDDGEWVVYLERMRVRGERRELG
jgi:hypothetical protein